MDPLTSLAGTLNNITDRRETWEWLKSEKANNPAFAGLDELQIGKVLNEVIGAPKGSRFDRFSSTTSALGALGYYADQVFSGAPTSIQGYKDQMAGKSTRNWSDVGADVGTAAGEAFGVQGKGLEYWTETGRGLPSGLANLALGAVPVVGMPYVTASTFGRTSDAAKAGGATPGQAFAAGAIDTAVNLLFLKASGPIADKAANVSLGKALTTAGRDALIESSGLVSKQTGKAITGRALVDFAKESGKLTSGQAFRMKLAAEATSEGIAGAVGVAGQIANQGILDFEGLKQDMQDPNYWASTIAAEGAFAVLGTALGNIRQPNTLAEYTRPEAVENPTIPVFQNSVTPEDDTKLVNKAKDEAIKGAQAAVAAHVANKTGVDATEPVIQDSGSALSAVASALIASDEVALNENAAQAAAHLLATKGEEGAQQVINNALQQSKISRPQLSTPIRAFRADYGELDLEVETPSGIKRMVLTDADLLGDKETALGKFATLEERTAFGELYDSVHERLNTVDEEFNPNFGDFKPETILSYQSFLEDSGIKTALQTTRTQVHYTNTRKSEDWLGQFFSGHRPSAAQWTNGNGTKHVFINAVDDLRRSDLHEMGHLVDNLIDDGGFGEDAKAQWNELKTKFAPISDMAKTKPGATNALGTDFTMKAMEATGDPDTIAQVKKDTAFTDFSKYYATTREWAAQSFQGYMLDKPTQFKNFLKTNFSALDKLFTTVTNAFKKRAKLKNMNKAQVSEAWQSGQVEAQAFFESIFNSATKLNTEAEVRKIIKSEKLSPKLAESFYEAIVSGNTLAGRELAFEAVDNWSKSSDRSEQDLLDVFSYINVVNKSAMTLQDLIAPTVRGLPNVRRLMNLDYDLVKADLERRLPQGVDAEESLKHLKSVEHFANRGIRALEAVDVVLSHKIATSEVESNKQSFYDRGIRLMQMDHVIGKWFRGELPGQEGRFMWEPRVGEKFEGGVKEARAAELGPVKRREAAEILLKKEFPTLAKAIRELKTGYVEEGRVAETDGNVKGRNKFFTEKEDADAYVQMKNRDAQNYDLVYSAKPHSRKLRDAQGKLIKADGKSVTQTGYEIRWRKDSRRAVVTEYRDDLIQLTETYRGLDDEPETKAYLQETQKELVSKAYFADLESHVIRLTQRMFADYRAGNINALPEQFRNSIKEFARWSGKEGWKTFESLKRSTGNENGKIEDILLSMSKMPKADRKLLLVAAGEEFTTVFHNYKNYAGQWINADFEHNLQLVLDNKLPILKNDKTMWKTFVDGILPNEDKNFHEQMSAMQFAMPGGVVRKSASGTTYSGISPRTVVGRSMRVLELAHAGTYGGVMNIAESNPRFKALAHYHVTEEPRTHAIGNRLTNMLRGEMRTVTLPNGDTRLELVPDSEKHDDRAYIATNASLKVKPIADQIQRWQNEAGGIRFKEILANDLSVGRGSGANAKAEDIAFRAKLAQDANDLMARSFDQNNPKHVQEYKDLAEYLERTYAFQREAAKVVFESEFDMLHLATANALYQSPDFTGDVDHAKNLANQLNQIALRSQDVGVDPAFNKVLTDPVANGGLGWDMHKAITYQEKWAKSFEAIKNLQAYMESTPGYVKETRMRQWHVKYAEKQGGTSQSGLADFDTAEEAWKFINDAKTNPNITITSKRPEDQYEKNSRLRTGSDMLEKNINQVVNTRLAMLDMLVEPKVQAGIITPAEHAHMKKIFSGIAEDSTADAVANRVKDIMSGHRFFKAGRERLDMAYQQEESGWRMAIQYARKRTDLGFELHMADESLAPYEYERKRFQTAKDALRIADGNWQRKASKLAFSYYIIGNVSSALIEAAQWPLSLSHILVEDGAGLLDAFKIPTQMFAKAGHASASRLMSGSDKGIWDAPHAKLIKYAELSDRLGMRALNDISTEATKAKMAVAAANVNPGSPKPKRPIFAETIYKGLNNFYGFFSRINAETSLVASYEVHKKNLYGNKPITPEQEIELYEKAIHTANKANGSWGRGNRPWWFDTKSPSGRTVAQLAWSLQGFASNHVANHLRLLKKSIGSDEHGFTKEEVSQARKALGVLTTMQVAGLGIMGHTLAGGVSKLLTESLGYDPETEFKEFMEDTVPLEPEDQQALSDLILYGTLHAADFPADIQARMSVSGIGPLNSYEGWNMSSLGGPVLSTIGNMVDGWNTISKGDGSIDSYMRWGTNFAPAGLQRALRMAVIDDNKVYNRGGDFVMDPTVSEKAFAYLGFAPKRFSEHMKVKTKMMEANQADGRERDNAASRVNALMKDPNRSFEALQLLQTEAQRLQMSPELLAMRVAGKQVTDKYGKDLPEGSGPNAQRAARLYQSPLPMASSEAKKTTELQALAQLNMLPAQWNKSLMNARLEDMAKQNFDLSGIQARAAVRNPLMRTTLMNLSQSQTAGQTSLRPQGLSALASPLW